MKTYKVIIFSLSWILAAVSASAQSASANRVYRIPCGITRGFNVWIVDGNSVRRDIYPEFLYGGNDQRYLFIPEKEIWIDQSISSEEYNYTMEHEIYERALMAAYRMSYADAHDSALAVERRMRIRDFENTQFHEHSIRKVRPVDCDGQREIITLPDSIVLRNVYRRFYDEREGIQIWIVDGAIVRREIFPDFGFSGNDLAYQFIPEKEIWIDGQVSCEETEFSVTGELCERNLMSRGVSYDSAYMKSLELIKTARRAASRKAASRPGIKIPTQLDREFGGKPK
ncbi:MAG: hypothetical protein NTV54_08790 [Ignavibacteriales bacterium]|nr:hypothetical protein [Ignavibacteriales bacterium]